MLEKKYELVKDMTLTSRVGLLHRIRALKDFSDVKKGDLGGYVSSERNLSHYDNCWVCGRFYGTLLEFKEWIINTHGSSKITKEYLKLADLIKFKFTGGE